MSNVWRIGSKYSGRSTFDDFRKSKLVFAGNLDGNEDASQRAQEQIKNDVQVGDLIAIGDGNTVKAIGRVSSRGPLAATSGWENFKDIAEGALTCLKLDPLFDANLPYPSRSQFCKAGLHYETLTTKAFERIYKTYKETQMKEDIKDLLNAHKQIVLTGAPGTGKTFLARQVAADLLNCPIQNLQDHNRFGFVQFHPGYDYTDFVEGLKPVDDGRSQGVEQPHTLSIGFQVRNGIFRDFCEEAERHEKQNESCVFVIDEINRADLSRVFGELFYALEYRGKEGAVKTQYFSLRKDKRKFHVPGNILIVGTMNNIDRSVESIDFALRRRFAWYEIEANGSRFDAVMKEFPKEESRIRDEARQRYENLNRAIETTEGLGKSYQIGPAYYRRLEHYLDKEEPLKDFWKLHLEPLIREYLRGMAHETETLKKLQDAYDHSSPQT